MVTPSTFDASIQGLGLPTRAGAVREVPTRPEQNPAARPQEAGQGNPVRGAQPAAQTLSSPFVAQFIAQEVDPPASEGSSRAEVARGIEAFRQANANAARGGR